MIKPAPMDTAAGFLQERRDFLHVYAAPSVSGSGWDVVVRIDGTYDSQANAEDAASGIRQMMEALKDVPMDGRTWWNGPPWRLTEVRPDSG
jgi:hypothetical protein